ncbi:hypothetical protein Ndes2526B_g09397 [Nannochloris sp. 'desiccata']|nr:hypothetical protein KSW81_003582 [Chlorella desiccata (nom. nud.)]KAH7616081.1 hypothetical protein NADE_000915 [Chlorella desiccata (nom. nud.)]
MCVVRDGPTAKRLKISSIAFLLTFLIVASVHFKPRQLAGPGQDNRSKGPGQVENVFHDIYNSSIWGDYGNGSGEGSTIEMTKRTRLAVELLVTRYKVNALLDAPCGAMAWMPIVIQRLRQFNPRLKYCGVDVVLSVIEKNKLKHQQLEFLRVDIAQEKLPTGFDMIWSRDALQHLSYELIIGALENFGRSGVKYVAVGSYKAGTNRNIPTGGYFDIDLTQFPFNLDGPIDVLDEETPDNKVILVYSNEYLRDVDYRSMRQRAGLQK